jgi:hypothetical protein
LAEQSLEALAHFSSLFGVVGKVEKRTKRHGAEEIGRQVGESSCLAFFSDYLLCILFSSFFSPSFVTSFFSFPAGVPPHSHVTLFYWLTSWKTNKSRLLF